MIIYYFLECFRLTQHTSRGWTNQLSSLVFQELVARCYTTYYHVTQRQAPQDFLKSLKWQTQHLLLLHWNRETLILVLNESVPHAFR